jgi:hypothetical protein
VQVVALILLLFATVITTGSSLAMLLALRRAAPKVSWKVRLLPGAVLLGAGAVFEWSHRAYGLLLLILCGTLLIGTMALALVQIRRSRRT